MTADRLEQVLDYRFDDKGLLEQALTHRSASVENNERLEFLGDSVLNFIIAGEVYHRRSAAPEGELSRLRANLVNKNSLAALAKAIRLGDDVRLGGGEMKSGGHRRASILADCLEAVFGAIYLDGGFDRVAGVVRRLYADRLANLPSPQQLKDPKTRLQEYLQARKLPLPEYEVAEVGGQAHDQVFRVVCRIGGVEGDTAGEAGSRRQAEQRAAELMLATLSGGDGE